MRILQVCPKPIYPPIEGGSIAMFSLYQGLVDNGHTIHVVSMNTHKQFCDLKTVPQDFVKAANYKLINVDIRIRPIPAFVNLIRNKSYNMSRFDSSEFRDQLCNLLSAQEYDIIILETLYATPYIDAIREKTKALIILRSHNVEFMIWENLSRNETHIFKRMYLKILSKQLKKYELRALEKVDLIASISEEDNRNFELEGCQTKKIFLPFGINFNASEYVNYSLPSDEDIVLFHVGSMNWIPHQEAFKWFLNGVCRKLYVLHPNLKLYLAGAYMPEWITKGNYPNVIVTDSYVNGKSFMKKKGIMIVPSFSGSGIRIKIVEGMALGKVIITTQNGAMGVPCTHNENIFILEREEDWISTINNCINNLNEVQRISKNARNFAMDVFDSKSSARQLINAIS